MNHWFLDTTPRQWYHIFKQMVFALIPRKSTAFSTMASVGIHCLLIMIPLFFQLPPPQSKEALNLGSATIVEVIEVENKESFDPNEVYYRPRKEDEKESKKTKSIAELIKKLANEKTLDKTVRVRKVSPNELNEMAQKIKNSNANAGDLPKFGLSQWQQIEDIKNQDEKQAFQQKELISLIQGISPKYQVCFEKALLMDSDIAGNASFEIHLDTKGHVKESKIQFDGRGTKGGLGTMTDCLKTVTSGLEAKQELGNASFKFSLVFKS